MICMETGLTQRWNGLKAAESVPEQKLLPACGLESMFESPTTRQYSFGLLTKRQSCGRDVG